MDVTCTQTRTYYARASHIIDRLVTVCEVSSLHLILFSTPVNLIELVKVSAMTPSPDLTLNIVNVLSIGHECCHATLCRDLTLDPFIDM